VKNPTEPAGIRLHAAIAADAPTLTRIVRSAFSHYVERLGLEPAPMQLDYARAIATDGVHVAVEDEAILGLVVLADGDDDLLLNNLAVAPAAQGRGIGRLLIAFVEQRARERGHDRVLLYTNERMVENIALYRRLGYAEVARRCEAGYRRVHMAKRLRA
jgi:ribosomal protein S18 acetylase RimI-like enzyme